MAGSDLSLGVRHLPAAAGNSRSRFLAFRGYPLERASIAIKLGLLAGEQLPALDDHRFVKKRIGASLWFRSVRGALNTIAGYESMHTIRKGQIRWLAKSDVVGQRMTHQD
jgi:DDE domain